MAVPKKKVSKSRRDKRRTHYKAPMPSWTHCAQCGEAVRMHHVCPHCGQYKGVQVIEVKQK
ncbi:MAG: 50S ribosomal protein L32 [Candidatus Cloacimonetes bacterium]|nr:50S ribosomal protein L32 [Candidatus Cloacimonadota bacterium]